MEVSKALFEDGIANTAMQQEHTTSALLKRSALAKCNQFMRFADDIDEVTEGIPELPTNSLHYNLAIARVAFEFYEAKSVTVDDVRIIIEESLEAHLLNIINSRRFNPEKTVDYSLAIPDPTARREALLKTLSPSVLRMIGGNVLRSYFRAVPLTKTEEETYPHVADALFDRFRKYDVPFIEKDAILTEKDTALLEEITLNTDEKLTPEWLQYLNHLIRRGSKNAQVGKVMKEHNPIIRARYALLDELGWTNERHPMCRTVTNYLKRHPAGISSAILVRALRFAHEHNVNYVKFLRAFPSFAPADIPSIARRRDHLFTIFKIGEREAESFALLDTFVYHLGKNEKKLDLYVRISKVYKRNKQRPFTDADIRALLSYPIEAHLLSILKDRKFNPKQAATHKRQRTISEIRRALQEFLTG